ncbi:MAG TPA: hypothetical protein VFJ82_09910 [Longimicrobium sp.]|nr:hypothetical protein [Longimicrobium sp.]
MSQRQLVWRALAEAGVLDSPDPKVQAWLKMVRERSDLCWGDMVEEFRTKYYDVYEKVVPALEKSDDAFIRNMLIKHADPDRPKERQLLKTLATTTDFERNVGAAQQLSELGVKEVDTVLKKRLPEGVEGLLAKQAGGDEADAKGGGKEGGGDEAAAKGGGGEAGAPEAAAKGGGGSAAGPEAEAKGGGAEASAAAAAEEGGDAGGDQPARPSRKGRL